MNKIFCFSQILQLPYGETIRHMLKKEFPTQKNKRVTCLEVPCRTLINYLGFLKYFGLISESINKKIRN